MKITSLLDYADWDQFRLPPFTRRATWTHEKVISLFDSLYRGYPLGGFILHAPLTVPESQATHRYIVVDGVQRIAAIYATLRGRTPVLLSDAETRICELCFDLHQEQFVVRDGTTVDNPHYISLAEFFGPRGPEVGKAITALYPTPSVGPQFGEYMRRVNRLAGIVDRSLYIQYMPTDVSVRASTS